MDPLARYRAAIAQIESAGSGGYAAVGPTHPRMGRALGKYQVMEANVGPWSREALGREITADDFLANPQYQDAIFNHRFGGYVERFGPEGAAQAWFAGPGGVGRTERRDSLGTSVGEYTRKFRGLLGEPTTSTRGGGDMGLLMTPTRQPQQPQQQPAEEPRRGFRGLIDRNPDLMGNLAIGFNSMRLNPDPSIPGVIEAGRDRRGQAEQQEQAQAAEQQQRQEAAAILLGSGVPNAEMLAQAVSVGAMAPGDAIQIVQASLAAPAPVSLAPGAQLVNPTSGDVVASNAANDPSAIREYEFYAQQEARAGREPVPFGQWDQQRRTAGATQVNVGPSGIDFGSPPANHAWQRNPDGSVAVDGRGAPIALPVGPALRDMEAAEQAAGRQQALTERQINPTIDDIVTARDLTNAGVGRTGMMSGILQRVPVFGQGALDLSATIDAIGAGISLENLNQMRQASPTGGALGNVSDRQSALLSEAFGSLQQSQSKELFLYNLARVENVLNDIVHGPDGGPERHDLNAKRQELRRSMGIQAPEPVDVWGGAPAAGSQRMRFNPQTGELEPAR